jgi:hypothetical protein
VHAPKLPHSAINRCHQLRESRIARSVSRAPYVRRTEIITMPTTWCPLTPTIDTAHAPASSSSTSNGATTAAMGSLSRREGCGYCGAAQCEDGKPLLKCGSCRVATYCDQEHQKFDWKRHKVCELFKLQFVLHRFAFHLAQSQARQVGQCFSTCLRPATNTHTNLAVLDRPCETKLHTVLGAKSSSNL